VEGHVKIAFIRVRPVPLVVIATNLPIAWPGLKVPSPFDIAMGSMYQSLQ